jgi:hypothetical protein
VALFVPLELHPLEVESRAGLVFPHGGEDAAAHAIANLVGGASEVGGRFLRAE